MKKIICILLASLTALQFAACAAAPSDSGDSQSPTESTSADGTSGTVSESTAETLPSSMVSDLPEDLNFNNADFGIFTRDRDAFHGAITLLESDGDNLDEALYSRTIAVSEQLGVVFTEMLAQDTGSAKAAIEAGDKSYKLLNARNVHTIQYAANGLGYQWDKVEYIDLTKDYWYDSINQNLTIANKVFTAAGGYNLTSYDFTHVLMFNKELAATMNIESPYDLVKAGKWTFDKFEEFATQSKDDLNGDGVMDLNDKYGFVSSAKQIPPSFWVAAGQEGIKKDKDDIPQFTMPEDEEFLDVLMEIYELAYDTQIWYYEDDGDNVPPTSIQLFQENKALMMDSTFFYLAKLREMVSDFAILPYPKYTEEQQNYLSRIEGCELPLIPSCLSQDEANMTGAVLEALASYSECNTIPVYYDTYLKVRLTRDHESAEMIDYVFDNRVFDLSDTVWCDVVRDGFILSLFKANNRNVTSLMKRSINTVNKSIDNIVTGYTKTN